MKKGDSNYWKECDVNSLAAHFHQLSSGQYERICQLYLSKDDIDKLFPPDQTLRSFDIVLALNSKDPILNAYTFRPYVSSIISDISSAPSNVELDFQLDLATPRLSAKVPEQLKDWLNKNWMELEINLIDDVFTTTVPDLTKEARYVSMKIKKRLMMYRFIPNVYNDRNEIVRAGINPEFFDFINKVKGNIDYLIFYLGVDMNKYGHQDQFGFSPIFEVHFKPTSPKQVWEIRRLGIRCIPDPNGDETGFYEYMSPCPSTC